MTYATVHLHLTPYPAPTTQEAINYACEVAKLLEAKLDVSSSQLSIRPPGNWLTGQMMAKMAKELEASAAEISTSLESHLEMKASDLEIDVHLTRVPEHWPLGQLDHSRRGRVADVCVVGLSREGVESRRDMEDWLFGSGRPCILIPDNSTQAFSLDTVLICWDYSRAAARAVSDALPLLHNAKRIRIGVFRGEKDIAAEDAGAQLIAFLAGHGVTAEAQDIDIGDQTVGNRILEHADSIGANILVMGAFGQARLQEFLLGSATKEVLNKSTLPLLMSH